MDAYPALFAFAGSLAAVVLVEALLRLRVERFLVELIAQILQRAEASHQAEHDASSSEGSLVSFRSLTQSAMLRGVTGTPSITSTHSCTLTEKLERLGARDVAHFVLLRGATGPPSVASTPSYTFSEKLERLGAALH